MARHSKNKEYVYSFIVWPDETQGFQNAIYDYFKMGCSRVEMTFTHDEFELFRSALSKDGFTLREAERWPYCRPQPLNLGK